MHVTVCRPSAWEIITDEPDGERWCFVCRKQREFRFIVGHDPGPEDWYGPSLSVKCGTCKTSDADLFPGRSREWGDE